MEEIRDKQSLLAVRDRILGDIRAKHNLGRQAKSHQITKEALDKMVDVLESYTPESHTPKG